MWRKIIFFFLFLTLAVSYTVQGQKTTTGKEDSTKVYRKIKQFSDKSRFTKFIHKLIFKPLPPATKPRTGKQRKKPVAQSTTRFEGSIIRKINITVFDPFGYSIKDPSVAPQSFLEITGNSIHKSTLSITIRNLLLIHKNDPFDYMLAKESERLIRSQKYVREVIVQPVPLSKASDSVDVDIQVLDVWSLVPALGISSARVIIGLTENNFLGTGHEFQNRFAWNHLTGHSAYAGKYYIPNIRNSYVNTTLEYKKDENKNYTRSWTVERPFYSPLAKWAAGIYLAQKLQKDSIAFPDSVHLLQNFKFDSKDAWVGKAWQLRKGQSEELRSTNLILTARYYTVTYLQSPDIKYDSLHIYSKEHFFLSGIGISKRIYVHDKYIFNVGYTEDVPVGMVIGIVGGYQVKNDIGRWYTGMKISWGDYYNWGYFSPNLEIGTFVKSNLFEEATVRAEFNYFSGLFVIGNWKFRQFAKPTLILGLNRLATDHLTITGGIPGFNNNTLIGTSRILLTLQTQSYAPMSRWGFKFGPYFNCSLGMLGNERSAFRSARLYSQFGFGVLIRNEYLIFSTFQVSIAFYPHFSGTGGDVFKWNPYRASTIGFRDFDLQRPETISYQ